MSSRQNTVWYIQGFEKLQMLVWWLGSEKNKSTVLIFRRNKEQKTPTAHGESERKLQSCVKIIEIDQGHVRRDRPRHRRVRSEQETNIISLYSASEQRQQESSLGGKHAVSSI